MRRKVMSRSLWRGCLVLVLLAQGLLGGDGDDGPYVRWRKGRAEVVRAAAGRLETLELSPPFRLDLGPLAAAPLRLDPRPPKAAEARFPLPAKILAISDIHGRKDALLAYLQRQGVVNDRLAWTFGDGHLVVVGDVLDRGDQATECLWLLRALEPAARAAGGRVHLVLGNHEAMVLQGDLRYLHPKYPKLCAEVFRADLPSLYGPDTELGRWLRSRPALLRLGSFLFVHGGMDPASFPGRFDQEALNARVRAGLDRPHPQAREDALFGSRGPLWYRGLIPGIQPDAEATPEEVGAFLKRNQLAAMIVGHTTLPQVTALHGGQVIAVDAGFKEGLPGEGWLWEKTRMWRVLADGSKYPLP
jgi:hypothetical protein